MNSADRAVVMPGFGISYEMAKGTKKALEKGPKPMYRHVEIVPLNEHHADPNAYTDLLIESAVLNQSLAGDEAKEALEVVSFSGVEPGFIHDFALGGLRVFANTYLKPHGRGSTAKGLHRPIIEIMRSPVTTARLLKKAVDGVSTSDHLANSEQNFPGGRTLIIAKRDGFNFEARASLELARASGVNVHYLDTSHNALFTHPVWMAKQLKIIREIQREKTAA